MTPSYLRQEFRPLWAAAALALASASVAGINMGSLDFSASVFGDVLWRWPIALAALTALSHLDLSYNYMDAEAMRALAAPLVAMSGSLRCLDLHENELGVAGATALAPSLACLTGLNTLSLGWVPQRACLAGRGVREGRRVPREPRAEASRLCTLACA